MKLSKTGDRAIPFVLACISTSVVFSSSAQAVRPLGFPLVCRGAMNLTPGAPHDFYWSMTGASAAPPAELQCAWLDRAPRGSEIIPLNNTAQRGTVNGNYLVSTADNACPKLVTSMGFVPLGPNDYLELMVTRDPVTNKLQVQSWVGLVSPAFPSAPRKFPATTPCQ